jgi:hypothetical protein
MQPAANNLWPLLSTGCIGTIMSHKTRLAAHQGVDMGLSKGYVRPDFCLANQKRRPK